MGAVYTDVESDIFPSPLSSSVLHLASQMLEPTEQALYPMLNNRIKKLNTKVHDLMYSHTTDTLTYKINSNLHTKECNYTSYIVYISTFCFLFLDEF